MFLTCDHAVGDFTSTTEGSFWHPIYGKSRGSSLVCDGPASALYELIPGDAWALRVGVAW